MRRWTENRAACAGRWGIVWGLMIFNFRPGEQLAAGPKGEKGFVALAGALGLGVNGWGSRWLPAAGDGRASLRSVFRT